MTEETSQLTNLSGRELQNLAKTTLVDLNEVFRIEETQRETLETKVAKEYQLPIVIKKGAINNKINSEVTFNPDEEIEIKTELDENGRPAWFIRNKSISERSPKPPPHGKIREGSLDDLNTFIASVDANKMDLEELKEVKDFVADGQNIKINVFETPKGKLGGLAVTIERGNGYADLIRLVVNPDSGSQGIGSALIRDLKKGHDRIGISAIPFGTGTNAASFDSLRKFYIQNGFVNAMVWSKNTLSLDDIDSAVLWHKLDENVYSVGNGQHKIDINTIKRRFFEAVLVNPDSAQKLSEDTRQKLIDWKVANDKKESLEIQAEEIQRVTDKRKLTI